MIIQLALSWLVTRAPFPLALALPRLLGARAYP